jgi:hypothetical protein
MKKIGTKVQDVRKIMNYAKENFSSKRDLEKIKDISKKLKQSFR